MSRNVETVKRVLGVVQRGGDAFALEDLVAPTAQFHAAREVPGAGTFVGAQGFAEFIRVWTEDFADWTFRLTDVRDVGDRVVVFARQVAVGKGSGVSVEMEFAMLFALPDGLITDVRVYIDRDEALKAVGLTE